MKPTKPTTSTSSLSAPVIGSGKWRGLKVKHDKRLAQWFEVAQSRHFHTDVTEIKLQLAPLNDGMHIHHKLTQHNLILFSCCDELRCFVSVAPLLCAAVLIVVTLLVLFPSLLHT